MLSAFPSFAALTTVGGIVVSNNTLLATISGFGVLATISGNVDIERNGALSSCCGLLSIADESLVPTGTLTIENNASGCNSKTEITTDCVLPEVVHDGDLAIASDGDLPGNETTLTRIKGDLTISGTITTFPNFAALEVVEGNLEIKDITTATLVDLSGYFSGFG